MQAPVKTEGTAATATAAAATSTDAPCQRSLVQRLCARAVVFMFLPHAGKKAPAASESRNISPAAATEAQQPNKHVLSRPAVGQIQASKQFLGLETAKRYAANYARAFAAVVVGCGPLLIAATCVAFLNAVGSIGACTASRTGPASEGRREHAHGHHEQPERERLEQLISSISYRQRQKSRNLIRVDQLDSVSQLADFSNQPASAGDRCAICLESSASSRVRVLSCKHVFHAECIEPWLTTCCGFCPLCKAQLMPKND
ncbi:hypothetical protein LPJ57_005332 [Coemansia sp. RSA 486]|nr:hypothetical protein LPJ57_005332 [Coemansia sp. RSA 486]KAJ2234334.1 hypothetical protein IWW45_003486 [Coemansia sp. RSA 485]KAJ2638425.1 hypothetical protein GGF40_001662 [Coemansia sp. RSA 1286]